ncbi:MAG: hypothetical protein R3F61_32300 [Myxococcota bacterium]
MKGPFAKVYQQEFVAQVLELVDVAFSRLRVGTLGTEEEPSITGFLVQALRDFQAEMRGSDHFVWRYSFHDDPPVNVGGRTGKRRPRVDLRLEAAHREGNPTFPIEAKRLGKGHGCGEYLGPTGLGCFLEGTYGSSCSDVGMLGYVQTPTVEDWGVQVQKALSSARMKFGVLPALGDCFFDIRTTATSCRFRSDHERWPREFRVHHMLYACHPV